MKLAAALLLTLVLFTGALADPSKGLKPRENISSYPVHQQQQALALGAEQLSNTQVQHAFVTELDKRYIVVEVGVFPASDRSINLTADDFMLVVPGTNQTLRPVKPETIASVLYKRPATQRDVVVTPTMGVGYETASTNPDGTRNRGGWSTSSGAMVGVGDKQIGGTEADRKTMETELRDKQLPTGEAKQPVAGYLYFPAPSKKSKGNYELQYLKNGEKVSLALNSPSN
jgi:hypothetical protein